MSGAMGVGTRFVVPNQFVVDATGVPIVGAQLFFYATGTSTFQATYADVGLTIMNTNPLIADSAGRFGNVFMLLAPAYRVRLEDAAGGIIWDMDPVGPATGAVPGSVPIGGVIAYAGGSPPVGYLNCDGSAVSRSVFAPLFSTIGTTYGSGDGATTFNLPDLRGRVVAGLDTLGGVAANRLTYGVSSVDGATMGASGGDQWSQSHNHGLNDPQHRHDDAPEGHTHGTDARTWPTPGGSLSGGGSFAVDLPYATIAAAHVNIVPNSTGITINSWGNGSSENVQPTIVMGWCIFAG